MSLPTVNSIRKRVAERFNDPSASVLKILLGLFVWMSFTKLPSTPGRFGQAQSWEAVLSFAADRHLQWGRDVIFTFGPLGFLNSDDYWGNFFWPILLWSFGFGLLWSWIFLRFWSRLRLPMRVVLLVALPFLATSPAGDLGFDAVHLFAIGALGIACFPDEELKAGLLVACGVVLGVLGLVKLTFFGFGLFTVAVVWGAYFSAGKIGKGAILPASFVATILGGWLITGQRFEVFGEYFRNSAEVVSGYSVAMAGSSGKLVDWGAVFLGIAIVALFVWYWRSLRWSLLAGARIILLAMGLFFAWKEGFVRTDDHTAVYLQYCFLAAGLAAGLLRIPMKGQRSFLPLTTGAMVLALLLALQCCPNSLKAAGKNLLPRSVDAVRAALIPTKFRRDLERRLATRRNEGDLPAIRQTVGTASVGALFWDQDRAILNGLNYQPHPVFQNYSAYTPALQRLNAAFFNSQQAPQYLLWRFGTIDFRYPSLDDGEALLRILSSYSPILVERDLGLWKQNAVTSPPYSLAEPKEQNLEMDQWFSPSAEPTWTQIFVEENWYGRISTLVWRGPGIWLEVRLADGRAGSFRFLPGNGAAGFLLNPFLEPSEDLVRSSLRRTQVVAVRLHTNEPGRFNHKIRVISRAVEGIPALQLGPLE